MVPDNAERPEWAPGELPEAFLFTVDEAIRAVHSYFEQGVLRVSMLFMGPSRIARAFCESLRVLHWPDTKLVAIDLPLLDPQNVADSIQESAGTVSLIDRVDRAGPAQRSALVSALRNRQWGGFVAGVVSNAPPPDSRGLFPNDLDSASLLIGGSEDYPQWYSDWSLAACVRIQIVDVNDWAIWRDLNDEFAMELWLSQDRSRCQLRVSEELTSQLKLPGPPSKARQGVEAWYHSRDYDRIWIPEEFRLNRSEAAVVQVMNKEFRERPKRTIMEDVNSLLESWGLKALSAENPGKVFESNPGLRNRLLSHDKRGRWRLVKQLAADRPDFD